MSFPRYPKYKDSGVEWLGEVPEHWLIKPLKSVASYNDDVLDEATPPETEILYVDISGVDGASGIHTKEAMSFGAAPSRARRLVKHGDVIVSTVRTYLRAIARVHQAEDNLVVSTGFTVIRPRGDVLGSYLGYALSGNEFVDQVIARSTGVSYPAINANELVAIPVAIPPRRDQRAIASFLNRETAKIDTLVAEQQRLIALLQEKRQAVISHAVTKGLNSEAQVKPSGIEWLGELPAAWNVSQVKRIVRSIEQGWSPQCENFPVASDDEWGILKVGCVNDGAFNVSENKKLSDDLEPVSSLVLRAGDLLISRANTRDLVGRAAVVLESYPRLMICDKLYRLRTDDALIHPQYLALFLGTGAARGRIELEATGASASMVNITQPTILELQIPVPPIAEQHAIVSWLEREFLVFDTLIAESKRAIGLLIEFRNAVVSAAVTGKIDVRGYAFPPAA